MVQRLVRSAIGTATKLVRSNKTIDTLIYDLANMGEFSNLYEHEKMLADNIRVSTYHEAIRRHVKPGDTVIDLGTGTGILALFAARQCAKVYALDHSEFITIAKRIAQHNGLDSINFVQVNSKNFTAPEKVDFIIHEQMGDDLFNENMIDNLLDLKRRALKDTGKILPGRFELFLEPVALKKEYRVPFIWEGPVHGIDFGFLRDLPEAALFQPEGYKRHWIEAAALDFYLGEPEPILTVDLNEVDDVSSIPKRVVSTRTVVRPGSMDGFCLFFRAVFDDEIRFDTQPSRTCWANRLFRTPRADYNLGDKISYAVDVADIRRSYTWSFSFMDLGGYQVA
jgi:protein arginine N-methyltransferase 1